MLLHGKETGFCRPGYWLGQGRGRLSGLALFAMLAVMLAGCASVSGTVRATADITPVPPGLSWEAVPGPGADWESAAQVAEILKPALARYGWTLKPSGRPETRPETGQKTGPGAGRADALVYISWDTHGPEIIYSEEPDLSLGVGFASSYAEPAYYSGRDEHRYGRYGRDRYGRYDRRDPYWGTPMRPRWRGRYRPYYDEPTYRMSALYAHTLRVRAVRLIARPAPFGSMDAAPGITAENPATPPYAPALPPPGAAPALPPGMLPALAGMEERPLWEVNVTHVGSYASIRSFLPYLAAAAAGAAGRTTVEQVKVNRDLEVIQD